MSWARQLFTENVSESVEEIVDGSTTFQLVFVYTISSVQFAFTSFWELQNIDFGMPACMSQYVKFLVGLRS